MHHSSFRSNDARDSSSTAKRTHSLVIPSQAACRVSVLIPRVAAKTEHVVRVLVGKNDTNLSVTQPYFEPCVEPSQGILAAADAAMVSKRLHNAAYEPYVSDKLKQRCSMWMYFGGASTADELNVTSYEWVEHVSQSASTRRLREAKKVFGSPARPAKTGSFGDADEEKALEVGPPLLSDDEDDAPSNECEDTLNSVSATNSPTAASTTLSQAADDSRDDNVVFAISSVKNIFYIAVYADIPLKNVVVTVVANRPLQPSEDIRHPLRMCRMHNVNGDSYDSAVEWLTRMRTRLVQGIISLTETHCELQAAVGSQQQQKSINDERVTFLHVIARHLGDPRFARMLLKHCSRFLRKDERERITQRSALQYLFVDPSTVRIADDVSRWRARVFDVDSKEYFRALELLRLLLEEANCTTQEEDIYGNTVVHYAAAGHRRGSQLLPLLLIMGAPSDRVNLDGKTPADEVVQRATLHDLRTWDVDEALELLKSAGCRTADERQVAVVSSKDEDVQEDVESQLQQRRAQAADLIGHGVDLPLKPLRYVDIVPMKLRALGTDRGQSFPTPVVEVGASGLPVCDGPVAWAPPGDPARSHFIAIRSADGGGQGGSDGGEQGVSQDDEFQPLHIKKQRSVMSEETVATLRREFDSFDRDSLGWISVSDMRRVYLSYDGYGVSESTAEIDKTISVMGIRQDGRVTFDEYCILMLRMNRL